MSWQAVTWVLEQSQSTLGSRLVLLSIASHANREGKQSWPSVETICIEARLTRREVQYCLRELEALGELRTIRGGGRGRSNSYELVFVEVWVTAQSLRTLDKQRKIEHPKQRNLRQETAHPSAHEPFPNHTREKKEEKQREKQEENSILPVVGEPSKEQNERESEVNRLSIGRAMKSLARQKAIPKPKSAEQQREELRMKGWLQ